MEKNIIFDFIFSCRLIFYQFVPTIKNNKNIIQRKKNDSLNKKNSRIYISKIKQISPC